MANPQKVIQAQRVFERESGEVAHRAATMTHSEGAVLYQGRRRIPNVVPRYYRFCSSSPESQNAIRETEALTHRIFHQLC
jgi:hypothetical protein